MKHKRRKQAQKTTDDTSAMLGAVKALKSLPTRTLLVVMELIIRILAERGEDIRDFDNRDRVVKQARTYFGKCFFLCDIEPVEKGGESE